MPPSSFGSYRRFRFCILAITRRSRISTVRIVTVGLNPSFNEFPSNNSFLRFPAQWNLLDSCNSYFSVAPYTGWFSTYDHLLSGFDASFYYGKKPNTALHTDILSPVATQKPWSQLDNRHQAELAANGVDLWHDLVRYLKPHILLISVAAKHKKRILFSTVNGWQTVLSFSKTKSGEDRKRPYDLGHSVMQVCPEFNSDFLFGRAAQKPFSFLSNSEKESIGPRLKKQLANW